MTRRHQLQQRLHALAEIREILNAMKNMALTEVHKLTRFLETQRRYVASLQTAGSEFLAMYPDLAPTEETTRDVCLLIGSERGFCGDFNAAVEAAWRKEEHRHPDAAAVVVGGRLAVHFEQEPRVAVRISGPTAAEEVEPVLVKMAEALRGLSPRLTVFHHLSDGEGARADVLVSFKQGERKEPELLYMEPRAFFAALMEQYLFAVLEELLSTSLMAENQRRLQHMDYALQRIDGDVMRLRQKSNLVRQEEITEEIEVIMLNAAL
jgi:F-type H+-transporting ATPase subunit gamma